MRKFLVGVFVIAMAILYADAQQPSTVTNLPFASTPFSGNEVLYVVQGGVSKKATFATFSAATVYTVATLPALGYTAANFFVSDAVTCTLNGALTGGGTVFCRVHYNGSAYVGG